MKAFMLPRDIGLFLRSARTDARIQRLRTLLGSPAAALEAVYASDDDPWAAASTRYRYQTRKYEVLASLLPTGRFESALDIGCGPGLMSRHLASRAERVVGVDIAASAVAKARMLNADKPNVRFDVHDLLELPTTFDGTFDLVVVADVLYYVSPLTDALLGDITTRIGSLLSPGGICLLANHYFSPLDGESRRSRRIHDAFKASSRFLARTECWRPFYLVTVLGRTQHRPPLADERHPASMPPPGN